MEAPAEEVSQLAEVDPAVVVPASPEPSVHATPTAVDHGELQTEEQIGGAARSFSGSSLEAGPSSPSSSAGPSASSKLKRSTTTVLKELRQAGDSVEPNFERRAGAKFDATMDTVKGATENLKALRMRLADATDYGLVVEIFRQWDDDDNGTISREEFRKALPLLGIVVEREEASALFDMLDEDGSGSIDYTELDHRLTADLRDRRAAALRSQPLEPLEAASAVDVPKLVLGDDPQDMLDTLRGALEKHMSRIIDVFHQWDEDGSGTISKQEFRRALPMIGLRNCPRTVIDTLFDALDEDHSGSIEYRELNKTLRRHAAIPDFGEVFVQQKSMPKLPTLPTSHNLTSISAPPTIRQRRPSLRAIRKEVKLVDPQQFIDNLKLVEGLVAKARRGETLSAAESESLQSLGVSESLEDGSQIAAALALQRGLQPQLTSARSCELSAKARVHELQKQLRDARTALAAKKREEGRQADAQTSAQRNRAELTRAVRAELSGVAASSKDELKHTSEVVNTRLLQLHPDPRGVWHRLFRRVDANDSGSMSFFDFKKIIRKHLKMPPSTLTDGLMNATWVALDCDDQGGVSGFITSADFAHFMRLGESVFKQRVTPRERSEAKAREAASMVRAEKHALLHRDIQEDLAGQPAATRADVVDLSRRFNERLEEVRRAENDEYEAHGAAIKL